jgi:hypothetical protein
MIESVEKGKESHDLLPPLHIEKTMGETMTLIPKGVLKKASHNPNARVDQNYSIIEDLAQTSCVMSSLEVLHSFPSQRKMLLSILGVVESANSRSIIFNPSDHEPCLSHHVTF